MSTTNRYFIVALEVDNDREDCHPEDDEVQLQIERALLEEHAEFGIVDAFAVPTSSQDIHPATRRALSARKAAER